MIYVHLAEGFEEIEAVTILDILRRGKLQAEFVSMTGDKLVTGAHGIRVEADQLFEAVDYGQCRMIVLPGGMPGTKNLAENPALRKRIIDFAVQDKFLAAICAAPMVLGRAGILEGRKATIFPGMEGEIAMANFSSDRVVVDGNLITSRGPGTAAEFSLKLLELMAGKDVSEQIRKGLVL